ncbi:MAG: hypothetical protein ACREBU_07300 [Nitrososphaera sp.]
MSTEIENYFKKLTDAHVKQIATESNKDAYVISGKEYRRRRIKVKEFNRLEELRAQFADEKDRQKAVAILTILYFEAAKLYLGMTEEEYFNAPWEETKFIIDACNFRTLYGAPFLLSSSTNSSG